VYWRKEFAKLSHIHIEPETLLEKSSEKDEN
jgi:hypothetical protein